MHKEILASVLDMEAENDALKKVALNLPLAKRTSANHMEVANDVLNLDARRVPEA